MKYIADGLTALRMLLAAILLVLIWQSLWALATVVLVVGILSDAFDGIAARRWPYSAEENQRLWWRKDAHQLDNLADLMLSGAALVGLALSLLDFWSAVVVVAIVGLTSAVIDRIVQIVGRKNPVKAERIDVAHGWLYGAELAVMVGMMTRQASEHWVAILTGLAFSALPLLWLKWDRITSRAELTYGG